MIRVMASYSPYGTGVGVTAGNSVAVADGVAVKIIADVSVGVRVAVGVLLVVAVGVSVAVLVDVAVGLGVWVSVGVRVAVGVCVAVGVAVALGRGVDVSVGFKVGVGLGVTLGVQVVVGGLIIRPRSSRCRQALVRPTNKHKHSSPPTPIIGTMGSNRRCGGVAGAVGGTRGGCSPDRGVTGTRSGAPGADCTGSIAGRIDSD